MIGASNEVPADDSLLAFYDRFLLRVPVAAVSDASFTALLTLADDGAGSAQPITRAELQAIQAARNGVALPLEVLRQLQSLRAISAANGITISDRRWRQLVGLLRTAALTEGRAAVDPWDLWLAPYVLAAEPTQVAPLQQWFVEQVAQAAPQEAPWLTRAVEAFEKQLAIEQSAQNEQDDGGAGKLALARSIGGAQVDGMLRMVTASLEEHLRKRYSPAHQAARLAQVDEVLARAQAHVAPLQAQAEVTRLALSNRLWLPPLLARTLCQAQAGTLAVLASLVARLQSTRLGFAELRLDEQLGDEAPEPVKLSA